MPLTAQFPQPSLPLHADCITECKLCTYTHTHTHTHTVKHQFLDETEKLEKDKSLIFRTYATSKAQPFLFSPRVFTCHTDSAAQCLCCSITSCLLQRDLTWVHLARQPWSLVSQQPQRMMCMDKYSSIYCDKWIPLSGFFFTFLKIWKKFENGTCNIKAFCCWKQLTTQQL